MRIKLYIFMLLIFFLLNSGCQQIISAPAQELSQTSADEQTLPRLSPDDAVAVAINDITPLANGFQLSHPQHRATFTADGVTFTPTAGGPTWQWSLQNISASPLTLTLSPRRGNQASPPLGGIEGGTRPTQPTATIIRYDRGGIHEEYHARQSSIEQQFIIPQPLGLAGADLVIDGVVNSPGDFLTTEQGWQWQTKEGQVTLGDVTVFDATGQTLPATLDVTADSTQLTVDGQALAQATYPVTIDPEIGANDFRISDMGKSQPYLPLASESDVAYNSLTNEYLVVWQGGDNRDGLALDEYEIYGQRINATTGAEVGENDFRISDMGPDGDPDYDALNPTVIYNPHDNNYLVVWIGDDDVNSVDEAFEAYGQLLDATGQEIKTNDFRISDMGSTLNPNYDVRQNGNVAVAYNLTANEYLVVWTGDDSLGPLVDNEFEVFGQRVEADGSPAGANDFRISDMGSNGTTSAFSDRVDVAYNSTNQEYLVVWEGTEAISRPAPLPAVLQTEIYGQRINAATGTETGTNDFRISDMGGFDSSNYVGQDPAIAYDSDHNEYLVVWHGDDNVASLVDNEFEIFGQLLNGEDGSSAGPNDFRISDMGPDGNTTYNANRPDVTYNSSAQEFLVVWHGFDNSVAPSHDQFEIFAQRLQAETLIPSGPNDFQVSDMGPDDNSILTSVLRPAVAYNTSANGYLVVWQGNDIAQNLAGDEIEIHGQLLEADGSELPPNDFRISDMWTDTEFDAHHPAVAYNSQANEYLVVWSSDDGVWSNATSELEIYGQRIDATTGAEIPPNDFRISDMGPDGDSTFSAQQPTVAYNSQENNYLVVWKGNDNTGSLADHETEIFGQLINSSGGEILPNDFRISNMGLDGDGTFDSHTPVVAYNSQDNNYLVVWYGNTNTGSLHPGEVEIFGQLISATSLEEGSDFRISDMGPDGDTNFGALRPAVAYNSQDNNYLVVWQGTDNTGSLDPSEIEIFGQLIDATGVEMLSNDFRISDMGPDGDPSYDGYRPAVAYNSQDNNYLVVWQGSDNTGSLVPGESEIFGQLISATGDELFSNDTRISNMGPDGALGHSVNIPAVAFNSTNQEYLVVWQGWDVSEAGWEIYGQRLTATGAKINSHLRLSDMGTDGDNVFNYIADEPVVATSSGSRSSLVVWEGDDNSNGLDEAEDEIFGQQVSFTAGEFTPGSIKVYLPLVTK